MLLIAGRTVAAAEPEPWSLPVMFPENASPAHRETATRLSRILGQTVASSARTNPVCCFWLELDQWRPNPGEPFYVVTIQRGGAIIRASSVEELNRAVEHVGSVVRLIRQKACLPVGMVLTNLRAESKRAPENAK
jgi:hypothetical protein